MRELPCHYAYHTSLSIYLPQAPDITEQKIYSTCPLRVLAIGANSLVILIINGTIWLLKWAISSNISTAFIIMAGNAIMGSFKTA